MIPKSLKEAIKSNNLIIFSGAGTSIKLGLPNWKNLTKKIINHISAENTSVKSYLDLLESDEMTCLQVLDFLEKYKGKVLDIVQKELTLSKEKDFSLHKKINELSEKIITTNYDKAFELALPNYPDVILNESEFKLSRFNGKKSFLFKIHNDIDSPEKCTLFSSQYEELYHTESAFLNQFKSIFSDKTILFIGFSLTDPYVNEIIQKISEIYKGFNNEHYIITTDKSFDKLKFNNKIIPLHIDSNEGIIDKLDELIQLKPNTEAKTEDSDKQKENNALNVPDKVTILTARPIDKDFNLNNELLVDCLSKYNIKIETNFLNLENLQNIEDSAYAFLFTKTVKNKFIIEDSYLKSTQYSLEDIDDNIPASLLNGVIIFYEGDIYEITNNLELKHPYILVNIGDLKTKDVFTKFIYHFFVKHELPRIENIQTSNSNKINFKSLNKGQSSKLKYTPNISKYLDAKVLNKFVGRKTDIENLIRKLIDLKHENVLLSIKGSGGIGKTTIITKAVIEIAERGYFPKGFYFIPCQSIYTIESFKFELSKCFDLSSSIKLEEQIRENYIEKDRLIILDNFETLLNVTAKDEILNLVSIATDFACIVTTTRQKLDLDFEDIYELRNMTTEEGVQLFKTLHPNVKKEDENILRNEIIDQLLNNNPLAIKLIAKGTVQNKNLNDLKRELESNIFQNENIEQIFERPEDINIEKSKSLYHSINYSYQNLSEKEKTAFEILSIFPDGIHLENLKRFSSASSKISHKITDREIKNLDDRSLLENSNNHLRLQSIIGRFAENQFKKQPNDTKKELYRLALEYNAFILSIISDRKLFKKNSSILILDNYLNNFLKSLEFLPHVEKNKVELLDYIDDLSFLFVRTNQSKLFLERIKELKTHFNDIEKGALLLEAIELDTVYYCTDFDISYEKFSSLIPFNTLVDFDSSDNIQKMILSTAFEIYECEGYSKEIIELLIQKNNYNNPLEHKLFKLGYHELSKKIIHDAKIEEGFTTLEVKRIYNIISDQDIKNYIKNLYKKQALEITQCTYLLSKYNVVDESDIKKLVISNPYTKGIIKLMSIPYQISNEDKNQLFLEAIENLNHIKYYHVEAILKYCEFLQSINSENFENWFKKGYELAIQYHFSYLIYLFEKLNKITQEQVYNEAKYTKQYALFTSSIEQYVNTFIKKHKA